jgi:hypothetical protein
MAWLALASVCSFLGVGSNANKPVQLAFHAGIGVPEPYIYIWCIHGIFGRNCTKYTAKYRLYTMFWPTLLNMLTHSQCTQEVTSACPILQNDYCSVVSTPLPPRRKRTLYTYTMHPYIVVCTH